MPNTKTHLIVGGATGAAVNVLMQLDRMAMNPAAKFDWLELALCTAAGGVAALLPDLLEPANSPSHRAFFHSATASALVAYGFTGNHTKECSPETLLLLGVVGCGYLSHLALDAGTPKSIPII